MNSGISWIVIGAVGVNAVQHWHPHAAHIDPPSVTLYSSSSTTVVTGSVSSSTATMTWAP
jgi:hypothetical protein